jgi:hypothetical protein
MSSDDGGSSLLLWIIVICLIAGLYGVGPCSGCGDRKCKAECIQHVVSTGDTLGKLSKLYYGDRKHWQDIKWQNDLQSSRLKAGQKLQVYVPRTEDWGQACQTLISARMNQLGIERSDELILAIANGIADMNIGGDPLIALEQCRWTIATAHQESMFEFAVGGAGEIGMYQFKLDTVRLTGRWYKINWMAQANDMDLVKFLLDPRNATKVFLLHYTELHRRYKGLWMAWKRYNNGSEAAAYASKAVKRYWEVRRLKPVDCNP